MSAGEAAIRAAAAAPEEWGGDGSGSDGGLNRPGEDPCAVTPIGHRNGEYHFLSPSGEYRVLAWRELTQPGITSLFNGETDWLVTRFPDFDRKGRVVGFDSGHASAALMRACVAQGIIETGMPVRGAGVWRAADSNLIVHCGDAVWCDEQWQPAGLKRDGALYPAGPRIVRPALSPATAAQGAALLAAVEEWKFLLTAGDEARISGAEIVTGWIGAAMLGGAPSWRAHLAVHGPYGSGKTWLSDLVSAALGAQAHPPQTNFTAAYLWQALSGEARAIVLDEAEPGTDGGAIAKVVELIRQISAGGGASVGRGSAGGRATTFAVTGCAYLASILPPPLQPQDRSRIVQVTLDRLPRGPDGPVGSAKRVAARIAEIRALSPALRARAVQGWARFCATLDAYRDGFLAAGCNAREADQLGTIAAGRDLLLYDYVPDEDQIAREVARFRPLLDQAVENQEAGEGEQCLTHLYTSPVDLWRAGERRTVAQAILNAIDSGGSAVDVQALGAIGLRLEGARVQDQTQRSLLVANRHVGLERIFAGTRWARGTWTAALRYLDGAEPAGSVRFAGVKERCTRLPARLLPTLDDNAW